MIPAMASRSQRLLQLPRALLRGGRTWWHIVHLGALVLALLPEMLRRPWRARLAQHVARSAAPLLVWFTLLAAIVSLVIIRIVLVTAQSYGLSQYALDVLVRVLVLELIPLTAAFAVALRVTIPGAAELARARRGQQLGALRRSDGDALRGEIAPRALAGMFSVALLAASSSVVALVLAYLLAHGFSPWAFERFTRLVGHVFTPAVTLVFALKTFALAGAVSLVPVGSALRTHDEHDALLGVELQGLVRMFVAMLVIETLSLVGSYL